MYMHTPNIDKLAATGLVFNRASVHHSAVPILIVVHRYCQQAVCGPSRNSFMTARRPHHTNVFGNDGSSFRTKGQDSNGVGSMWITMPEHFKVLPPPHPLLNQHVQPASCVWRWCLLTGWQNNGYLTLGGGKHTRKSMYETDVATLQARPFILDHPKILMSQPPGLRYCHPASHWSQSLMCGACPGQGVLSILLLQEGQLSQSMPG